MGTEQLKPEAMKGARSALYLALLTNTKGETKETVKQNKAEKAFESYRYITMKGKHATAMNIITMRTKALRPQPATTLKDVESCIVKWKADLTYLKNVAGYDPPGRLIFQEKMTAITCSTSGYHQRE